MISTSFVGFTIGAAIFAEGIRQYVRDPEVRIKRRTKLALDRAGILVRVKSQSGNSESIIRPKFKELVRMENGFYLQYLLPIGITEDDIDKSRKIIEGATSSEMVAWTEGQLLHMELYMRKIPSKIGFNDELLAEVSRYPLALAVGYGRRGIEIIDYSKAPNPHMYIAGISGGGKSNALNAIILQLLHNDNVRLYLGDPKRVEFASYRGIRNVEAVEVEPIRITKMVVGLLEKMKDRERFFEQEGYKNIWQYNKSNPDKKLPFIFLILDEIADFDPKDDDRFWNPLIELGRKGRSAGVYIIAATQRPSADVLPPVFKSNLGLKLAFKTSTLSNSRVILDTDAAFKLPSIAGRAIIDNGYQRQVQVPLVTENQAKAILAKLRAKGGGEVDGHNSDQ